MTNVIFACGENGIGQCAEVWRSSSRPRLKNGLGFRVERAGVAILSAVLRTMSIAPVVSRFVLRFGA